MKLQQLHYTKSVWHRPNSTPGFDPAACQLVLSFGSPALVSDESIYSYIRQAYPNAVIITGSTAGEILHNDVYDNSIATTAIHLEYTSIQCTKTTVRQHASSYEAGQFLMHSLDKNQLTSVFIISDGTFINGSELVEGINDCNPGNIPVTGGLAGDGERFLKTFVGFNGQTDEGQVTAIGFYGDRLKVGHGSFGGWDEFGPQRTITKSRKNELYEIDGKKALEFYKEYLGPYKDELPGSSLFFPLSIKQQETSEEKLVRTILGINEEKSSMVFAGNMPEGNQVRLMKANYDKLIQGSAVAAERAVEYAGYEPQLAILISCIGRKLILRERADEEVQAANEVFGKQIFTTGFYSYGEISPMKANSNCELHNQTMSVTTLAEV